MVMQRTDATLAGVASSKNGFDMLCSMEKYGGVSDHPGYGSHGRREEGGSLTILDTAAMGDGKRVVL